MSLDHVMRVRRAVMRLLEKKNGESVRLRLDGATADVLTREAVAFGKSRKVGVRVEPSGDTLVLLRDDSELAGKFAFLNRLEVGETHLLQAPQSQHRSIRVNVSLRGKGIGRTFSCHAEGDSIAITRVNEEAASTVRKRQSYDLSALERQPWLDLDVPTNKMDGARQAVRAAKFTKGWDLTTRLVRLGGGRPVLRVYRIDIPSAAADLRGELQALLAHIETGGDARAWIVARLS